LSVSHGPAFVDLHVHSTCSGDGVSSLAEHTHRAADLGAGIPEARDLARAAGFQAIATFETRQPRWLALF